jgi:hypothetical protein
MSAMRSGLAVAVTLLLALGTNAAIAQVNPAAEQSFRDGKRLMGERRFAEACDAFATSQRLEPNIATLMSLADCRQKNGQLATAWALFLEAEQTTRSVPDLQDLHATADARSIELESRLSYITINVPDESRLKDLVVFRDGEPVDPGLWNRAVPVDGGTHRIEAKAPGHEPWLTEVVIATERARQAVEVPRFKDLPAMVRPPAQPQPEPSSPSRVSPLQPPFRSDQRSRITPRRKAAIGLGLVGVGAIGGGLFAWKLAARSNDDAYALCPPTNCDEIDARIATKLNDQAQERALIGNIMFGAGVAAAIAGGYLWYTGAPKHRGVAIVPQLGAVTGIAATGAF